MDVLAIDLGANSGRGIVGSYKDGQLQLNEVHRFSNEPVMLRDHLHWDILMLFNEIKKSMVNAKKSGYDIKSLAIDSWGVDYGLIDYNGELACNPVHYRDDRSKRGMERLLKLTSNKALHQMTGMPCQAYNTVNQLMSEPLITNGSHYTLLNMPDLFNYFLTGVKSSEYSMVTTTQLYDYTNRSWHMNLIDSLPFDKVRFMDIHESGKVIGSLKQSIIDEIDVSQIDVISVTSHDTATALESLPVSAELFVATGTWIVVGCKNDQMTMNDIVLEKGFTNEGGKAPHVNLLKNQLGLWLLQEVKKQLLHEGLDYQYSELINMAKASDVIAYLDLDDDRFYKVGHMKDEIIAYCVESKQSVPKSVGDIISVIEHSLAKRVADTIVDLEMATDKTFDVIHLFGGGVQDQFLCDLISKYSNKKIIKGVVEASAMGNILEQLITLDVIDPSEKQDIVDAYNETSRIL